MEKHESIELDFAKEEGTKNGYEAGLFALRILLYSIIIEETPDIKATECEGIIARILTNLTAKGNREELIKTMDLALIHGPHNQEDRSQEVSHR